MIYNQNMTVEEIIQQSVQEAKQLTQKKRRDWVRRLLNYYGGNGTNKYIPILLENNVTRIKQNKSKVTYFEKPNFKDMELKSSDSIETKYRKIRAFSKPYKGAYIKDGDKKIRVWEASLDV